MANKTVQQPDVTFLEESLTDPLGDRKMPVDKVPLPMQKPL